MSQTIDQQFIEYIVKSLVSEPDAVVIDRRVDEKGVLLELHVAPADLGRVIGKRGATAQSLRTLLRALGTKQDARLNLKIIDPNEQDRDQSRPEFHNDEIPSHTHSQDDARDFVSSAVEEHLDKTPEVEQSYETEQQPSETEHSDRIDKARKELAEFDDLDV
jgi:predicted RNA-binding protein YlqC (UPF0109 family)